ncbi:zinc transport system substrate-binding protein [Planktotalea frisia]|uniref:High-affinity zinc uptake system protein ZnuA n=1 Tax=Planktotalea frisia TaxID=696762 RepID=A0A1L9NRQ3_9RHOB|nr:zinc ABC transporter substrate-binding protein [Planktotalea frisia]OJI91986.1 high-affinity zinc uptake system protein ZnuA precursor [Planktotalea frisia]PZX22192.1 zinc transport system substrate-binding protein [Planktotalea frisia]
MSRKLLTLSLSATLMGGTAYADAPKVAVDIAPVHSLVARVMEGVGTPDLIVQPGASPHEYSLRPSEASALQDADLVFWIGPDLTPWLTDTIETLAPDAAVTALLEADGTIELEFREGALFEAHDHDDEKDHDDEEGHEDHDDHADEAHDAHDDEEAEHDEHDHGAHDPHAWLSPQNAMTWLNVIAGQLSAADPDNAGTYFANAAAGRTEIEALIGEVTATLDPVRDGQFVVFHDAYQYFEADFDFPASGAISIGDASDPSPARIAEIQGRIAEQGIDCVLAEPQFNPGLVATVLDGTQAQTGILDPLGSDLEPGPALYPQLIRNLSTALAGCM